MNTPKRETLDYIDKCLSYWKSVDIRFDLNFLLGAVEADPVHRTADRIEDEKGLFRRLVKAIDADADGHDGLTKAEYLESLASNYKELIKKLQFDGSPVDFFHDFYLDYVDREGNRDFYDFVEGLLRRPSSLEVPASYEDRPFEDYPHTWRLAHFYLIGGGDKECER